MDAGAGVLFKNAFIPKLKAWIWQVTSEVDETEWKKALEPSPAAEAIATAKDSSMVASKVANVSRDWSNQELKIRNILRDC